MAEQKMIGRQSVAFKNPPCILGRASVAGSKEGEGPLGSFFDYIEEDPKFGGNTWEEAESNMQKKAAELALENAGCKPQDIRYMIAGDLLGQLIATSFGLMELKIPMFGVYGACSTMGESMSLASMLVEGGFASRILALTSSHFCGAEKEFRFPLQYGSQRPLAATWTVTGSGAVIIGKKPENSAGNKTNPKGTKTEENRQTASIEETESNVSAKKLNSDPYILIKGITTGKIVDFGIKDSMNMGACMAPAAADVIYRNLRDFDRKPSYYDKIFTGDLGYVGQSILLDILKERGYDISKQHMDCGIEIFCDETQDTHSGGSGCGCSAITLTGYILEKMHRREWKRVLFVPTGALLSPVSFNEGSSVPGIAHAVVLEAEDA